MLLDDLRSEREQDVEVFVVCKADPSKVIVSTTSKATTRLPRLC